MSKINFISAAMMASVSEGVSIRDKATTITNNLISEQMLAQMEGSPSEVRYFGPQMYNPDQSAVYTPFETPWEANTGETTMDMAQVEQKPKPTKGGLLQTLAQKPFYEELAETA